MITVHGQLREDGAPPRRASRCTSDARGAAVPPVDDLERARSGHAAPERRPGERGPGRRSTIRNQRGMGRKTGPTLSAKKPTRKTCTSLSATASTVAPQLSCVTSDQRRAIHPSSTSLSPITTNRGQRGPSVPRVRGRRPRASSCAVVPRSTGRRGSGRPAGGSRSRGAIFIVRLPPRCRYIRMRR